MAEQQPCCGNPFVIRSLILDDTNTTTPVTYYELREDGGRELREDNSEELREY